MSLSFSVCKASISLLLKSTIGIHPKEKADRRLGTLVQHLEQYDNYKQYRDIYVKYKQLDPKKLTAERFSLCDDFYGLKEEIKNVEILRRGVGDIMRKDGQERQRTRTQGMEL